MGLSSSQARLLTLTARMHQIEYKAARLEAMKLQMANESRRVYEDYLDALDKTKIQMKTLTSNGALTFIDVTSYSDFLNAGFALQYNGLVYDGATRIVHYDDYLFDFDNLNPHKKDHPESYTYVTTYDGQEVCMSNYEYNMFINLPPERPKNLDFKTLCKNAFGATSEPTGEDFITTLSNLINSGMVTIITAKEDGTFPTPRSNNFGDFESSVAINPDLQEVTDEVELRKAEAKYEADMKRIDMKDRRYDTDLAALDNERNAIKQNLKDII